MLKEKHDYQSPGKAVIYQIKKTLHHHFSELVPQLASLPDSRDRIEYTTEDLAMCGINMFLFKEGSRNAFNNDRKDPVFKENYTKLFNLKFPHLDTTDDYFRVLSEECLEDVKTSCINSLIRRKVLQNYKYKGYYTVAIDATGAAKFKERHCDCCMTKTYKNGTTLYFHHVLEAKLITPSGLSFSIASEWIGNEEKKEYQKQDCERAAFKRLAAKIKKKYPRLPILLIADGLYPYKGFFDICKKHNWGFVVTLKDGNLKLLQEEISLEKLLNSSQQGERKRVGKDRITTTMCNWLAELDYMGHKLNWVECAEEEKIKGKGTVKKQRFVHMTNLQINNKLCVGISDVGRLRQKIENEGFNIQKNHGYDLEHLYSRVSFLAMKNFYQALQIAHIINQMVQASKNIATLVKKKLKCTIKYLWKRLMSFMLEREIDQKELKKLTSKRFQIRLE